MPSAADALIGISEGEAPKTFALEDLNGKTVDAGEFFGRKPVIIVFWGLSISKAFLDYSMDELRFLNDVYERYHEKPGLEIIAVYTPQEEGEISGTEIERVKNLVTMNKIKFPVLLDTGFTIFREYGVIALPSTIMIDRTGKIKFIYPSFPLSAQPLFAEEINGLIGLAKAPDAKEPEQTKGPDSHSIRLYNYALQMHKKGLHEQAFSPLKKSIEMDAGLSRSHNLMGILLWKRGNFEGASEEFSKAVMLDKNNVQAHFNYAVMLFEGEKYTDAERHFKDVLSLDNGLAEAHYVIGLLYKKTNKEEQAIKELGTALALFEQRKPSSVYEIYTPSVSHRISTLYELSELHGKKGEPQKALELLQKAAQIALGLDGKERLPQGRDLMLHE